MSRLEVDGGGWSWVHGLVIPFFKTQNIAFFASIFISLLRMTNLFQHSKIGIEAIFAVSITSASLNRLIG